MSFSIDEKVVCIHTFEKQEDTAKFGVVLPKKGEMYTIRTIGKVEGNIYLRFNEIVNPSLPYASGVDECQFWEERFRKLDYQFAEELETNLKKQVNRETSHG